MQCELFLQAISLNFAQGTSPKTELLLIAKMLMKVIKTRCIVLLLFIFFNL